MSDMLNTKEVAARLRVSEKTVIKLIREGRLKAINVGSELRATFRVESNDLEDFIQKEKSKY